MQTFSDFSLSANLKQNLTKQGFIKPTPIQASAFDPAVTGQDLVATAQTGTGKTLAFVLPILQRFCNQPATAGVQALVLSPTRELAIQINEVFSSISAGARVRTALAVGGLNERAQLQSIRKGAQVLIATPGRLDDFIRRRLVDLAKVNMFVLDEADRMLDMGFLPTIKRILAATPSNRQTLFFSATMEPSVKHLVEAHVRNPVRIELGSTTKPTSTVDLHLYEVEQDRKLSLLEWMLREQHGSFLVFARTKRGVDRLSKKLFHAGVKSAAIHGDRSQSQRNQALRGFQEGTYRVLVATDVAARGIHVDGISQVVNYDLPQVPEDFVHRAGRTGRAGARGTASTFATRSERTEIAHLEKKLGIGMVRQQVALEVTRESSPTTRIAPRAAAAKPHKSTVSRFKKRREGKREGLHRS
jgi:ATP-dependent RNA helicase RhlE